MHLGTSCRPRSDISVHYDVPRFRRPFRWDGGFRVHRPSMGLCYMWTAVKFQVLLRARTSCHHLPVETTDNIVGCLHSGPPFLEACLMKIAAAVLTPSSFLVGFEVVETNWAFALD